MLSKSFKLSTLYCYVNILITCSLSLLSQAIRVRDRTFMMAPRLMQCYLVTRNGGTGFTARRIGKLRPVFTRSGHYDAQLTEEVSKIDCSKVS